MAVAWKSVGFSRYKGDTNGVEQFLTEYAANRVLDLIELVSREPGCRRLTVNEGRRTRPRQLDLWKRWQAGTGYLAASPYTSKHDEVTRGNAADLGGPDGEALNAAEVAAIKCLGPTVGVTFAGLTFTPPEPWHVEAAQTPYERKHFPIVITRKDEPMYLLKGSKNRGNALVAPGYAHSLTAEEENYMKFRVEGTIDAKDNDTLFDIYWNSYSLGRPRK